jgi:hypothetical protein
MTYFRMSYLTLSSARSGFTAEFEMGSGGTRSPWSPGKLTVLDCRFFLAYVSSSLVGFRYALPNLRVLNSFRRLARIGEVFLKRAQKLFFFLCITFIST